jgi:hypothetical protein
VGLKSNRNELKEEDMPNPKKATPAGKSGAAPSTAPRGGPAVSAATTTSKKSIAGLEVTSTQANFRRAGFSWSKEPTFIALDQLTEKEIAQLKDEPMLTVREVDVDPEECIQRASK